MLIDRGFLAGLSRHSSWLGPSDLDSLAASRLDGRENRLPTCRQISDSGRPQMCILRHTAT